MNESSSRTLYYFLTLLIVTVLFIVAGVYLIGTNPTQDRNNQPTQDDQSQNDSSNDGNIGEENKSDNLTPDQEYYVQAVNEFEAKNYQAAINNLNQAIANNPQIMNYYSLKSEAEIITGKVDDAKKTLELGLQIDPENELLSSKLDALNREYFFPSDEEATRE